MFGRQNAAVPQIFVENLCIPHSDSPAPRMVVAYLRLQTLDNIIKNAIKYHEADVRLVRVAGRRNRPALPPHLRSGLSRISSSSEAQSGEGPHSGSEVEFGEGGAEQVFAITVTRAEH